MPTYNSTYTTGLGYTPIFRIENGGLDITGNFADRCTSIQVTSYAGGANADECVIVMDDRDFALASPQTGESSPTTLDIALGYKEGALYEQGNFQVIEVYYEGMPRTMRIMGHSLGFANAAKAPMITSFDNKSLGDIMGSLAESAGVSLSIDQSLASKIIPFLHQHSSSMHLIQEMERRYNAQAKFQDGYLSFTQRGTGLNASQVSIGGFDLRPEDLASWSIRETNRTSYSKVRAAYFDKNDVKTKWVESTTQGAAGATIPHMLKRGYPSQQEAQDAANSIMSSLNRGIHNGTVTLAKGDPSIRGGGNFTITGMRDGVDGAYTINKATHSYVRDQGISTVLEFTDAGADGISPDTSSQGATDAT